MRVSTQQCVIQSQNCKEKMKVKGRCKMKVTRYGCRVLVFPNWGDEVWEGAKKTQNLNNSAYSDWLQPASNVIDPLTKLCSRNIGLEMYCRGFGSQTLPFFFRKLHEGWNELRDGPIEQVPRLKADEMGNFRFCHPTSSICHQAQL